MRKSSSCRAIRIVGVLVLLFVGASSDRAHNTWLVSSRYSSKQPASVRLALVTTEYFPTSEYRTSPHRVAEWVTGLGHEKKVIGDYHLEGLELVAHVHLDKPGVHVIAAALHPRFVEFEVAYFNQYLADELLVLPTITRPQAAENSFIDYHLVHVSVRQETHELWRDNSFRRHANKSELARRYITQTGRIRRLTGYGGGSLIPYGWRAVHPYPCV